MAGKPARSSNEPQSHWNKAPIILIYQWKIKREEWEEGKHNLKAKRSEWPP